jgi:hypothetical protein
VFTGSARLNVVAHSDRWGVPQSTPVVPGCRGWTSLWSSPASACRSRSRGGAHRSTDQGARAALAHRWPQRPQAMGTRSALARIARLISGASRTVRSPVRRCCGGSSFTRESAATPTRRAGGAARRPRASGMLPTPLERHRFGNRRAPQDRHRRLGEPVISPRRLRGEPSRCSVVDRGEHRRMLIRRSVLSQAEEDRGHAHARSPGRPDPPGAFKARSSSRVACARMTRRTQRVRRRDR